MLRPQVLVWMLVAAAACTVPNPRLHDLAPGPDQAVAADLAMRPRDLRVMSMPDEAMPDAAAPCNTDTRCGPLCEACMGQTPHCSADGTHCVGCRTMQDCANSAQPNCTNGVCACAQNSDCGSSIFDVCGQGGVCSRSCTEGCTMSPEGNACLSSLHCGCVTSADCVANATCVSGTCMCGGTVCKSGATCQDGTCI